jgi:signal transduction histidine kinase
VTSTTAPNPAGIRRFRRRLFITMMVVVAVLMSAGIYFAQHRAEEDARVDLQGDFELELAAFDRLQELRSSAVADRSRSLVRNPRIHAALEDNALDLLYPSARDELRDIMADSSTGASGAAGLHAIFYRFLDSRGAVIPPTNREAGVLPPEEESQLAQDGLPQTMQTGYLTRAGPGNDLIVEEMIAVPIRSTETSDVIAALVLGFRPVETMGHHETSGMKNGILVNGQLDLPGFKPTTEQQIAHQVMADLGASQRRATLRVNVDRAPYFLFYKRLNPDSNYPPAYEVCVYPLTRLAARQRHLRIQILGAGGVLLLGGFFVSHVLARRLAQPVEELAVVSEENLAQRQRAEAELQTTAEELQRTARFSADASHQLKSPITVLRAGLDSLLARDGFPKEVYEEISELIHQTFRLTSVVEDLLLLSRMDAGKLRLSLKTVDLRHLLEECIDDLRALPEAADLRVEMDLPSRLEIAGEAKFTALIVQNLLDNARKYNHPGGIIRVKARADKGQVELRVANTGHGIPPEAQPYIFERFHRAAPQNDVPGHGLGLNLARELARLHGGELRLLRSDEQWTEFSALFLKAPPAARSANRES